MILTECDDFSRESKEYWDKRLAEKWHLPFHGMFLDNAEVIEKMDKINLTVIEDHLDEFDCGNSDDINILECACGSGRYIPMIRSLNKVEPIGNYVATDFGTENIKEAVGLYGSLDKMKIFEMDMIDAPKHFKDVKFDVIFMVSALSSIERNYRKILDGLKTLLRNETSRLFIFEQDFYMVHRLETK